MSRITIDWLIANDVCEEGLASFREHYPQGVDVLVHLRSLKQRKLYDWAIWEAVRLPEFERIKFSFLRRVLADSEHGALRYADDTTRPVVEHVIALLDRQLAGGPPTPDEWVTARRAAVRAAEATGATGAAVDAARVTWWATRAAEAAWAARWQATGAAALTDAAGETAAGAAWAIWVAARAAQVDWIIELLDKQAQLLQGTLEGYKYRLPDSRELCVGKA